MIVGFRVAIVLSLVAPCWTQHFPQRFLPGPMRGAMVVQPGRGGMGFGQTNVVPGHFKPQFQPNAQQQQGMQFQQQQLQQQRQLQQQQQLRPQQLPTQVISQQQRLPQQQMQQAQIPQQRQQQQQQNFQQFSMSPVRGRASGQSSRTAMRSNATPRRQARRGTLSGSAINRGSRRGGMRSRSMGSVATNVNEYDSTLGLPPEPYPPEPSSLSSNFDPEAFDRMAMSPSPRQRSNRGMASSRRTRGRTSRERRPQEARTSGRGSNAGDRFDNRRRDTSFSRSNRRGGGLGSQGSDSLFGDSAALSPSLDPWALEEGSTGVGRGSSPRTSSRRRSSRRRIAEAQANRRLRPSRPAPDRDQGQFWSSNDAAGSSSGTDSRRRPSGVRARVDSFNEPPAATFRPTFSPDNFGNNEVVTPPPEPPRRLRNEGPRRQSQDWLPDSQGSSSRLRDRSFDRSGSSSTADIAGPQNDISFSEPGGFASESIGSTFRRERSSRDGQFRSQNRRDSGRNRQDVMTDPVRASDREFAALDIPSNSVTRGRDTGERDRIGSRSMSSFDRLPDRRTEPVESRSRQRSRPAERRATGRSSFDEPFIGSSDLSSLPAGRSSDVSRDVGRLSSRRRGERTGLSPSSSASSRATVGESSSNPWESVLQSIESSSNTTVESSPPLDFLGISSGSSARQASRGTGQSEEQAGFPGGFRPRTSPSRDTPLVARTATSFTDTLPSPVDSSLRSELDALTLSNTAPFSGGSTFGFAGGSSSPTAGDSPALLAEIDAILSGSLADPTTGLLLPAVGNTLPIPLAGGSQPLLSPAANTARRESSANLPQQSASDGNVRIELMNPGNENNQQPPGGGQPPQTVIVLQIDTNGRVNSTANAASASQGRQRIVRSSTTEATTTSPIPTTTPTTTTPTTTPTKLSVDSALVERLEQQSVILQKIFETMASGNEPHVQHQQPVAPAHSIDSRRMFQRRIPTTLPPTLPPITWPEVAVVQRRGHFERQAAHNQPRRPSDQQGHFERHAAQNQVRKVHNQPRRPSDQQGHFQRQAAQNLVHQGHNQPRRPSDQQGHFERQAAQNQVHQVQNQPRRPSDQQGHFERQAAQNQVHQVQNQPTSPSDQHGQFHRRIAQDQVHQIHNQLQSHSIPNEPVLETVPSASLPGGTDQQKFATMNNQPTSNDPSLPNSNPQTEPTSTFFQRVEELVKARDLLLDLGLTAVPVENQQLLQQMSQASPGVQKSAPFAAESQSSQTRVSHGRQRQVRQPSNSLVVPTTQAPLEGEMRFLGLIDPENSVSDSSSQGTPVVGVMRSQISRANSDSGRTRFPNSEPENSNDIENSNFVVPRLQQPRARNAFPKDTGQHRHQHIAHQGNVPTRVKSAPSGLEFSGVGLREMSESVPSVITRQQSGVAYRTVPAIGGMNRHGESLSHRPIPQRVRGRQSMGKPARRVWKPPRSAEQNLLQSNSQLHGRSKTSSRHGNQLSQRRRTKQQAQARRGWRQPTKYTPRPSTAVKQNAMFSRRPTQPATSAAGSFGRTAASFRRFPSTPGRRRTWVAPRFNNQTNRPASRQNPQANHRRRPITGNKMNTGPTPSGLLWARYTTPAPPKPRAVKRTATTKKANQFSSELKRLFKMMNSIQ